MRALQVVSVVLVAIIAIAISTPVEAQYRLGRISTDAEFNIPFNFLESKLENCGVFDQRDGEVLDIVATGYVTENGVSLSFGGHRHYRYHRDYGRREYQRPPRIWIEPRFKEHRNLPRPTQRERPQIRIDRRDNRDNHRDRRRLPSRGGFDRIRVHLSTVSVTIKLTASNGITARGTATSTSIDPDMDSLVRAAIRIAVIDLKNQLLN